MAAITDTTQIALLSDIHSEAAALAAVEAELAEEGIGRAWCLGDSVDWLLPREPLLRGDVTALRRIRERCQHVLAGNHEFALLDDALGLERLHDESDGDELLAYLRSLRPQLELSLGGTELALAHASLLEPYWSFIETADDVRENFACSTSQLILFGHTHLPFLASCDSAGRSEIHRLPRPGVEQPLDPERRWLVNPGSVGRGPLAGVASWALLRLGADGRPCAVSWRYTHWRTPLTRLFG